jgi:N-acetylmuramoyl-L-alanine amidase
MSEYNNRYPIVQQFLPASTKRRSGLKIAAVKFLVAHDTGNPRSTARGNVSWYNRTATQESASAHLFVDDKDIVECVPAFENPEKAWHVWYSTTIDNELYGTNANDSAIGVEYCYGDNINADEAYRRYIWVLAKLCVQYNLDPLRHIVGHFFLDPKRKTDPVTGLAHSRRTYDQLLQDVHMEVKKFSDNAETLPLTPLVAQLTTVGRVNVRDGHPSTLSPVLKVLAKGERVNVSGFTAAQPVNGNSRWYKTDNNGWIWAGGVA